MDIRTEEIPKSCESCPFLEKEYLMPDYKCFCHLGAKELPEPWPVRYMARALDCPLENEARNYSKELLKFRRRLAEEEHKRKGIGSLW